MQLVTLTNCVVERASVSAVSDTNKLYCIVERASVTAVSGVVHSVTPTNLQSINTRVWVQWECVLVVFEVAWKLFVGGVLGAWGLFLGFV